MLIPSSPCPAATAVRFSSPPPAANSNRSPPSLSRWTQAAVISYQPSPGLPASQVTVLVEPISDLLVVVGSGRRWVIVPWAAVRPAMKPGSGATDLGHFGAECVGRPLPAQRAGD